MNTTPRMRLKETARPPQRNKLAPPILYYFVGAIAAIVFTGVLVVTGTLSVVCCCLHCRCAKNIGQGKNESDPSDHVLADFHDSQVFKEKLDTIV